MRRGEAKDGDDDLNALSIFCSGDDGDNHDKGNDNGSPTDTKMTEQKRSIRIILTNGWNDYSIPDTKKRE